MRVVDRVLFPFMRMLKFFAKKPSSSTPFDVRTTLLNAGVATDIIDKMLPAINKQKPLPEGLVDAMLPFLPKPFAWLDGGFPKVIVLLGSNGSGKTSLTAKMAALLQKRGKKVLVGGCDTFRAAAFSQLSQALESSGAEVVGDASSKDPASVAYKAVQKAIDQDADCVLLDTAGRLHTQQNLMQELSKIDRVVGKLLPESWKLYRMMVIDATLGYTVLKSIEAMQSYFPLDAFSCTKLDGSSKGGIMLSVADKFSLPCGAISFGEKLSELKAFDPNHFAHSLFAGRIPDTLSSE